MLQKYFSGIFKIYFFISIPVVCYATDYVDRVLVEWIENGTSKSEIISSGNYDLHRDAGTAVNIVIYKNSSAPATVDYWYSDWNNSKSDTKTSSNSYYRFNNAAGPLETRLIAGVNTTDGSVSIYVYNIEVQTPDLTVSNITVDGQSSPQTYKVGQQVRINCIELKM